MNGRFLLRIGAVGSAVAVLMLLITAVTPWLFGVGLLLWRRGSRADLG